MNKAELDKVEPALEMENLEHAVTEMSEVASNMDYWTGLFVQVFYRVLRSPPKKYF